MLENLFWLKQTTLFLKRKNYYLGVDRENCFCPTVETKDKNSASTSHLVHCLLVHKTE